MKITAESQSLVDDKTASSLKMSVEKCAPLLEARNVEESFEGGQRHFSTDIFNVFNVLEAHCQEINRDEAEFLKVMTDLLGRSRLGISKGMINLPPYPRLFLLRDWHNCQAAQASELVSFTNRQHDIHKQGGE